jgi:hypothetical protein
MFLTLNLNLKPNINFKWLPLFHHHMKKKPWKKAAYCSEIYYPYTISRLYIKRHYCCSHFTSLCNYPLKEIKKYEFGVFSNAIMCIPNFIIIHSTVLKLKHEWERETDRQIWPVLNALTSCTVCKCIIAWMENTSNSTSK